MKKQVTFTALKSVKKPTEVEFTTRDGQKVDFTARKPTKVRVRVRFKARTD